VSKKSNTNEDGVSLRPSTYIREQDEDGVSLRPSDAVADDVPTPSLAVANNTDVAIALHAPPDLSVIRAYRPTGDYDKNRLHSATPRFVYRGLMTLTDTVGRTSLNRVACWALNRGLARLDRDVPEIAIICEAHSRVLLAGAEHSIVQLESWSYAVPALYGASKPLNLRSVNPEDQRACADRAQRLGLHATTLITVAMMTALVDCPLPGDLPDVLMDQLREFRLAVRQRARLAQDLARRAAEMMQAPPRRGSWSDVCEK
jgi:hypothetical protein